MVISNSLSGLIHWGASSMVNYMELGLVWGKAFHLT